MAPRRSSIRRSSPASWRGCSAGANPRDPTSPIFWHMCAMPYRSNRGAALALAVALVSGLAGCSSAGTTNPDDDASGPRDASAVSVDAGGRDAGNDATVSQSDAATSHDAGGDAGDPGNADAAVASFAVGVTTRTWVDATRPTPQNGTEAAKTSRSLVTEIWYPASGPSTPSSARDAPLAPGGPYPLVLFVHGSSSSRTVYSFLTVGLAKAGYVVAAADFPLTVLGMPGGSSDLHVTDQVGDLSFLC